MSEQEMLVLSTKDRDRLKVLHEVRQGHLTQRQAGEQLGLTDHWVRRLLVRVKKEGDRGVVHRLRGRVSNRRLPEKVRRQALKLVQAQYRDFGPTLACEYLAKDHQGEGEQGDAAPGADRRRAATGEGAESGGGARVAAAPEPPRRGGAVGHLGTRRAGRARTSALLGGD